MSIVMPSNQLLHSLVQDNSNTTTTANASTAANSSNGSRKRYLDDLDALDGASTSSKRIRTAPPSPPLGSSSSNLKTSTSSSMPFTNRRSLSPTPQSNQMPSPSASSNLITPKSPLPRLAEPINIEKLAPVLSVPTVTSSSSSSSADTQLPSFKYLTQNDRYAGSSKHSLDYPDTCINDDDWRHNLELWIEKNFPEKFQNLKNVLRFDKPGFDLLNDAILLNELKEQLENEKRYIKPSFNSKISKKMVLKKSNPYYIPKRVLSDSDELPLPSPVTAITNDSYSSSNYHWNQQSQSSPIASSSQLHTVNFPFEANYTYHDHSSASNQTSPISLPPLRSDLKSSPPLPPQSHEFDHHHHQQEQTHITTSPKSSKQSGQRHWNGHHKLNESIMLQTNNFIHTQNHKGPNHTYTIHHHNPNKRKCISCGSDQSPCWRPSWSTQAGQLCNSCGLRYKKTGARCMEKTCCRIPAKGEWTAMKSRGKSQIVKDGVMHYGYKCLHCGSEVEVKDKK